MRTGGGQGGGGTRVAVVGFLMLSFAAAGWPDAAVAAPKAAERALQDAEEARKKGRPEEAIAQFRKFVELAPQDERVPFALVQAGDLLAELRRIPEALEAYGRAAGYRDSADARLARARSAQLTRSALADARARAERAGTEEERMRALWDVGQIHEWAGDPAQAAEAYREVRASAPTSSWREKAAAKLAALVEERVAEDRKGPPTPSADRWQLIARLAEAADQWLRAAEYYGKAADLVKDPAAGAGLRLKAARAWQLARRPADALAAYRSVMAAAPAGEQAEAAHRGAGLVLEDMGRWEDAARHYRQYLESSGGGAGAGWAWLRAAWCERRLGRTDAALRSYREFLERHPKHPLAAEALVEIGDIEEGRKAFDAARAAFTRAAEEHAGTPKGAEARARLLALPGKVAEWERMQAEIARMAERHSKRERSEP